MKLITKDLLKKLPKIGKTEGMPRNQIKVPLKLFNPVGAHTWYIIEFDPEKELMYGFVNSGAEKEFGYISFSELKSVKLLYGLRIERDKFWDPDTTLEDVCEGRIV